MVLEFVVFVVATTGVCVEAELVWAELVVVVFSGEVEFVVEGLVVV